MNRRDLLKNAWRHPLPAQYVPLGPHKLMPISLAFHWWPAALVALVCLCRPAIQGRPVRQWPRHHQRLVQATFSICISSIHRIPPVPPVVLPDCASTADRIPFSLCIRNMCVTLLSFHRHPGLDARATYPQGVLHLSPHGDAAGCLAGCIRMEVAD